jgi:capsular polysaccharide biosynthesis protein
MILIHSYNNDATVKTRATQYYQTQPGRVAVSDIQQSASLASSCVILFSNMPEMTSLMTGASATFEQVEESNFIRINTTSSNPQVAANVANQLADQAPKCFADMYGKGNGKVDKIKGASAPSTPTSPNVNQNTLYGLAIGFIIGVLLSFMLEIIDTTLKPGDDLAKMYNIPVFAEIVDFEKVG